MATKKKLREHVDRLIRFANEHGVETEITRGAKHSRVVLSKGGESCFVTVPSSPGDTVRGPLKALQDGRLLMRSKGWIK